jgi:hypothetical protein
MTGRNRYRVMSNKLEPKTDPSEPMVYQIRIKGHLGRQWTDWFEGLTITLEDNGDTLLTGPVIDQTALHGLLKKVRDLGMPLVSVNPVESCPERSRRAGPLDDTPPPREGLRGTGQAEAAEINETHQNRSKKGDKK